ncbi:hypothetical protein C8D87_105231 [Lentzea atacamensis]|uniref:Uncharacterized protein n=1 Tax=Lentzea atacamensis TaxID=531938 RepID=A0ABX9E9K9_9PSEU|nr:hypothetical protein C8D87_105231 [Lentzea atacamensis]
MGKSPKNRDHPVGGKRPNGRWGHWLLGAIVNYLTTDDSLLVKLIHQTTAPERPLTSRVV